jgi:hypothetical protein
MNYAKLAQLIPVEKQRTTADKLIDVILRSKNDDKMPSELAKKILYQWQQDLLVSQPGLSALLEAATLLEQEKTLKVLTELQLGEIANKIKGGIHWLSSE